MNKSVLKDFLNGVSAGLLITIGSSVFLACENNYVGAVMFSVALLCICIKGYNLYTGKIGLITDNLNKNGFSTLLLGLAGNLVGTVVFGLLISFALPRLQLRAETMFYVKTSQTFIQTLIRGTFCGVLMFLAVSIYRDGKNIVGILFCIPVFILSGFEHSIADMAYFAISQVVSVDGFIFIITVVLGNSIGALILPLLKTETWSKENKDAKN